MVFQLKVIGPTPPVTETVAEPSNPPLQETLVELEIEALYDVGSETLTDFVIEHKLASVIVTE